MKKKARNISSVFLITFIFLVSKTAVSLKNPSKIVSDEINKYIKADEHMFPFIKISSSPNTWTEMVGIVPGNRTPQEIKDVLSDWLDAVTNRRNYVFPLFPVQNNGLVELENLDDRIRQATIIAWVDKTRKNPQFLHHPDTKMVGNIEQIHKDFFIYHIFDDPQLGFNEALDGMLSDISMINMGLNEENLPKVLNIAAKTMAVSRDAGFWIGEQWSSSKANLIWNNALQMARNANFSNEEALELADHTSRYYDEIWAFTSKHAKLTKAFSLGVAQGTVVLERILVALTPVIYIEQAEKELMNIRKYLNGTGDERLLLNAINVILPRVRGEVDLFIDKLINSIVSQEFMMDLSIPAVKFVIEFMAAKSAVWAIPFIGKVWFAIDIGLLIGDVLSNNTLVSKEFESAKYAQDIEEIFYRITFEKIYPELKNQIRNKTVSQETVENFDSAVNLALLSECYFWKKVINGYNSTGYIKNILDNYFRGATGPEVAQQFLPAAKLAAEDYAKWCKPKVVEEILQTTLERMGIDLNMSAVGGTALALIIDSTGSMQNNDPQNTRIFGGKLVMDQAGSDWELGLVDFDTSADLVCFGAPSKEELKNRLNSIDSSGGTNIQAGLKEGHDYLVKPNKNKKGAILLTDGVHNTPSGHFDFANYVDTFVQKGWPVFTIGLTGDANAVLLSEIASMTGGLYLKANTHQDMIGIIDIILSEFKQEAIIAQEKSAIKQDETIDIPFYVDKSAESLNKMGTYPGSRLDFFLIDPQNNRITTSDPSKGVEIIEGDIYKITKIKDPLPGEWQVQVKGIDVDGSSEPFAVKVSAESPIKVTLTDAKAVYNIYEPIEYFVNVTGDVDSKTIKGSVKITDTEGNIETSVLKNDKKIRYEKTGKPGVYYFDISLEGRKNDGERFMRKGLKHIVVSSAGTPFGIGEIIKAEGSYIEINMGTEIGLKAGRRIFVFDVSSGAKNKIADGLVISTFVGRSVVELESTWGSVIPQVGHMVEVDRREF